MAGGPIEKYLETEIGLDSESIGRKRLEAVIAGRMREQGISDPAEYCRLIAGETAEREHIIEDIVVPETWFFRDQGPFQLLADLCAGGELTASPGHPLRVLSLPCATGEEPYSIAITLVGAGLHPAWLAIDGLDISTRALAKARQGLYGRSSFRGSPGSWKQKYFSPDGKNLRLQADVAQLVRFQQANVLGASLPLNRDCPYRIIFCRNLLIYLTRDARRRVFERFDQLLEPGGLLVAGHTEVLLFQQFGYDLMPQRGCFACRKPAAKPVKKKPARPAAERALKAAARPSARASIFSPERQKVAKPPQQHALASVRGLADRGELEKAAALCRQYLQGTGSLEAQAHCLMGEISQALNFTEAAEQSYLRAVYLDPACYDALVHLSLLYEHAGSRDKARRFRQRARRLHEETA